MTNNDKYWVNRVWISELQCSAIVNLAVWWTNVSVYKAPANFMFREKAGSSEELVSTISLGSAFWGLYFIPVNLNFRPKLETYTTRGQVQNTHCRSTFHSLGVAHSLYNTTVTFLINKVQFYLSNRIRLYNCCQSIEGTCFSLWSVRKVTDIITRDPPCHC
jgi:hypothetical protein